MKYLIFSLLAILVNFKEALASDIPLPTDTGLPDPAGGIMEVITNFLSWLLTVFMVLAVLAFVITGLMYIFAMGNERSQNLENAKNYLGHAITALVIVGSAYIIIITIDYLLTGTFFF
ncbi:MAG: hypothetical protein R6V40_03165 [Candidatus Moraniibacteriota bacterium]